MARTSERGPWTEIYDLILELPIETRTPLFKRFQELQSTPEWKERYNHELLWYCYNESLGVGKDVFREAADEYEEVLAVQEAMNGYDPQSLG